MKTKNRRMIVLVALLLCFVLSTCIAAKMFKIALMLTPDEEVVVVEVTATPTIPLVVTTAYNATNEAKILDTSTFTPCPTDTPTPTVMPTATAEPEPIILTGLGDSVVDLDKWDSGALVHISYSGDGNFAVWNIGAGGEKIDLLVNTIGQYNGTCPLDFHEGEQTTRFEVTSSGQWEIEVLPLSRVKRVPLPGTFGGSGDEVVLLVGEGASDLLKASATGTRSNFAIWGYGYSGRDLLINEIAPYKGVVAMNSDTIILVIKAEGNWSIEVTARQ